MSRIDISPIIEQDIRSKFDLSGDVEIGFDAETDTWYYRVPAEPQMINVNIVKVLDTGEEET